MEPVRARQSRNPPPTSMGSGCPSRVHRSTTGRQSRSVLGESAPTTPRWSGAPRAGSGASPVSRPSPTVYAGQRFNHRESGGTADAPDLGSGARKGVGVRLSPLAPLLTWEPLLSDPAT